MNVKYYKMKKQKRLKDYEKTLQTLNSIFPETVNIKREGDLLTLLLWKGGLIREGGLNRGFTVVPLEIYWIKS